MEKLTLSDLLSLEQYHEKRKAIQELMRQYKKDRRLAIGDHATLYFENKKTIQYQIQEMLHAERIFVKEAIQDELDVYNPLIPDGDNWKATFMLEYADPEIRKQQLKKLIGIEDRLWVQVGASHKIYAIADEDLERKTDVKTSAVHFVKFQLDSNIIAAVKNKQAIIFGIEHPEYNLQTTVPDNVYLSLLRDLQ